MSPTLKYGKNSRLICVVALASLLLGACSDELSRARPYVLTTATTGGTFYPVGVAIATIAHAQLAESDGISMTAISSAGSLENIKLLRDNQAQFAILQGPFGAWSWDGEGPVSSPQTHLRSVSALWKNVEHFVLLSELSATGTMQDLNLLGGERYVLGPETPAPSRPAGLFWIHWVSIIRKNLRWPIWDMVQQPAPSRTATLSV